MAKAILGKKLGMTQVFRDDGEAVPVTVIEAGPCVVVQHKTVERDGYEAVQVGFGEVKPKRLTRPEKGHFDRAGVPYRRYVREIPFTEPPEVGAVITADIFQVGEYVDVTGVSKGKGFAGVIRRHGFGRGPMTHGSKYHRGPGSLAERTAARVPKGRKLPGRLGGRQVTVQRLEVVRVDPERSLLFIRGAVPGPRGTLVRVRDTKKKVRA